MISAGNIWLAQDALVYDSLDSGQRHCPLGLSFTFSAAVQHGVEQLVVKEPQLFCEFSIFLTLCRAQPRTEEARGEGTTSSSNPQKSKLKVSVQSDFSIKQLINC